MNPATAQILDAVDAVPADQVIVLPNNKNIVPVAEQVVELSDKAVRVVPTTGIAEGFAALLAYDPEATVEENARSMAEAAARVLSGEVTRAGGELGMREDEVWAGQLPDAGARN